MLDSHRTRTNRPARIDDHYVTVVPTGIEGRFAVVEGPGITVHATGLDYAEAETLARNYATVRGARFVA